MTDNLEWALQFESSKRFNNNMVSDETRTLYLRYLRKYSEAVGKNPDQLISLKTLGLQNIATDLEFAAENLLEDYLYNDAELKSKPNVAFAILRAVKSFYAATRGRALDKDVGKKITVPLPKQRKPTMKNIIKIFR